MKIIFCILIFGLVGCEKKEETCGCTSNVIEEVTDLTGTIRINTEVGSYIIDYEEDPLFENGPSINRVAYNICNWGVLPDEIRSTQPVQVVFSGKVKHACPPSGPVTGQAGPLIRFLQLTKIAVQK